MAASTARQLPCKWGLLVTQWPPSSGKQVSRSWGPLPAGEAVSLFGSLGTASAVLSLRQPSSAGLSRLPCNGRSS